MLQLAVETRADVDPAFVDFEQIDLALGEHHAAADLDVVGPRGGVGQDAVVEPRQHDFVAGEEAAVFLVQPLDDFFGRERLGIDRAESILGNPGQNVV